MSITSILWHADALHVLENLPTDSLTATYFDPPWLGSNIGGWLYPSVPERPTQSKQYTDGNYDRDSGLRAYLITTGNILQQIHRATRAQGNVFVHGDPALTGNLRLLLDQVFGRNNFRAEYILPRFQTARWSGRPPLSHESILHYGKSPTAIYNAAVRPLSEGEVIARFPHLEPRGRYRLVDLTVPARDSQARFFDWHGVAPPSGRQWRFSKTVMEGLATEGRIVTPGGAARPRLKEYVQEAAAIEVGSIWDDISPRRSSSTDDRYVTQRPIDLLSRIVQIGSEPGDIVCDPMCGSGTARLDRSSPNFRSPPPGWRVALAKLLRRRTREHSSLADRLERENGEM